VGEPVDASAYQGRRKAWADAYVQLAGGFDFIATLPREEQDSKLAAMLRECLTSVPVEIGR
jgi:hypothetical protein